MTLSDLTSTVSYENKSYFSTLTFRGAIYIEVDFDLLQSPPRFLMKICAHDYF